MNTSSRNGQVVLLLVLSFLSLSCQPEDYPTEVLIAGVDSYCSEAQDLNSCQMMPECRPTYGAHAEENEFPTFIACVANPDHLPSTEQLADVLEENY
jgi:hypothetical protein